MTRFIAHSVVVAALALTSFGFVGPASARPDTPGQQPARQTAAAFECDADQQGCTSPREHVRKFKRGYYDRAGESVSYSKPLKRKILRKARWTWNRTKSRPWRSDRYRWRKFRNIDNCWASTYGDITHACTTRPEKRQAARRGVWVKKVAFCGSQLVPVWFVKGFAGRAIAALPGAVNCPWAYTDKDLR